MAPRTLKETYSRKKSSEFVESAITIQGGGIGTALTEKLNEELREGEEMPDASFFLELMARRMGRFRTHLVDMSEAHVEELAADDALRKMRNQAMVDLTHAYITTRHTVAFGYSPEDAAVLGFEPNVATDPAAMELQIKRLLVNFAKPEVQQLRPLIRTVQFLPSEGEATFRSHLDKLITARDALNQEHRKADETLLAKNDAVAANDLEFGQISRFFEATFVFAGRTDLAKRVRPSSRRPGRRQEAVAPPVENGEDGDEGGSSAPPETEASAVTADPPTTPAGIAGTIEEDRDDGTS
ncbi:MAG: hypothetical protein V3T72_21230 [Thermoanaerobaculia bacterium]